MKFEKESFIYFPPNYPCGGKKIWTIILNGEEVLHREDGPASILYHVNGKIWDEKYYINGKLHRENGPAIIRYYDDGAVSSEEHYMIDKLHKECSPAVIFYHANGTIKSESYFLNGNYLSYVNKEKNKLIKIKKFNEELEKYYISEIYK